MSDVGGNDADEMGAGFTGCKTKTTNLEVLEECPVSSG